jgi:hypothetical protein
MSFNPQLSSHLNEQERASHHKATLAFRESEPVYKFTQKPLQQAGVHLCLRAFLEVLLVGRLETESQIPTRCGSRFKLLYEESLLQ